MATKVFFYNAPDEIHGGTNTAKLDTTTSGWVAKATGTAQGSGLASRDTNTVTGATNGVEVASTVPWEWITPPIDAAVTISGAITGNLWASENNMSANVAINFVVDRLQPDGTITQIVKSARTTELGFSGSRTVQNFTATPGAGVACSKGDRLCVRVFGDDAGTMATGFTFSFGYDGTTAAADGDSFISFTETFGFQTTDPTGSTLYLTDTASDVATASVDREAWTSRGGGVVNDVTNTTTGWIAPIQVTDTAGGTVVDWFSKQLQAFTLAGKALVNLRATQSDIAADASAGVQIAKVDADGTNAVVWAYACVKGDVTVSSLGELATTENAWNVYLAAADLSFTDGQRIRIRLFVDDMMSAPLVTGHTVTTYYNGTSGGASGDTFLILPQTVAEFTGGTPVSFLNRNPNQSTLLRM
jgi:hypothetical protein